MSGSIYIGGIVSKIARFYGIKVDHLEAMPPILLNDVFIKNSKQFSLVNEKLIWLGDSTQEGDKGENEIMREIDEFQGIEGEVLTTQQEGPSSQRKRIKNESTSRGA